MLCGLLLDQKNKSLKVRMTWLFTVGTTGSYALRCLVKMFVFCVTAVLLQDTSDSSNFIFLYF